MKTALRLTIQFAWAYVGLLSTSVLICMLWSALFGHVPLPFTQGDWVWRISNTSGTLLILLVLGAFMRSAWRAVFRFSESSVAVTVGLSSLVMVCVFLYGKHYYLQPLIESHLRSILVQGLIEFAIGAVGCLGAWKFASVMQRVFARVLFPRIDPPTLA